MVSCCFAAGALWTVQQGADALASAQSLPLGLSGDDAAKAVITLFFLVMSLKSRIFRYGRALYRPLMQHMHTRA